MFLFVGNAPRLLRGLLVALTAILSFVQAPHAAEMLMLEQPGCPWCKRFNEEIAPIYAKTQEGRRAPLRRVDITKAWPDDLAGIVKERLTPTFVLIEDGVEIDRLRGYPGDEFFWSLIDDMLAKLPAPGSRPSSESLR